MKIRDRALKIQAYKPKPFIFPEGFILIIDTREQNRLFSRTKGLCSLVDTLADGDYSIQGFEDKFAIERKQLSDFYSYIGKERKKTVQKLERLSTLEFAGLVVETTVEDLMVPNLYSSISPEVARQFLVSVNVRYGIHTFLSNDRVQIERWVLDRAIKYYRIKRGG